MMMGYSLRAHPHQHVVIDERYCVNVHKRIQQLGIDRPWRSQSFSSEGIAPPDTRYTELDVSEPMDDYFSESPLA